MQCFQCKINRAPLQFFTQKDTAVTSEPSTHKTSYFGSRKLGDGLAYLVYGIENNETGR